MMLNLNFKIKDFKGIETAETAGQIVSGILSTRTDGITPIKAMDWAHKFYFEGQADIDRTDLDLLKKVIEASEIFNIAKAPILLAIKDAEVE